MLLIEDDPDVAEGLRLMLELDGHEVSVVDDGRRAIEDARETRPDVVLCDIGLPGPLDGYAVARALREDDQLGNVFLVALTGYGRPEDRARAREAGFDLHVTKPIDPARIREILSQLDRNGAPRAG